MMMMCSNRLYVSYKSPRVIRKERFNSWTYFDFTLEFVQMLYCITYCLTRDVLHIKCSFSRGHRGGNVFELYVGITRAKDCSTCVQTSDLVLIFNRDTPEIVSDTRCTRKLRSKRQTTGNNKHAYLVNRIRNLFTYQHDNVFSILKQSLEWYSSHLGSDSSTTTRLILIILVQIIDFERDGVNHLMKCSEMRFVLNPSHLCPPFIIDIVNGNNLLQQHACTAEDTDDTGKTWPEHMFEDHIIVIRFGHISDLFKGFTVGIQMRARRWNCDWGSNSDPCWSKRDACHSEKHEKHGCITFRSTQMRTLMYSQTMDQKMIHTSYHVSKRLKYLHETY